MRRKRRTETSLSMQSLKDKRTRSRHFLGNVSFLASRLCFRTRVLLEAHGLPRPPHLRFGVTPSHTENLPTLTEPFPAKTSLTEPPLTVSPNRLSPNHLSPSHRTVSRRTVSHRTLSHHLTQPFPAKTSLTISPNRPSPSHQNVSHQTASHCLTETVTHRTVSHQTASHRPASHSSSCKHLLT